MDSREHDRRIERDRRSGCLLLALAVLVALGFFLSACAGCTRGPSVRQQPTATVETEGNVVIEQPTISEIARDLVASVKTVGGDISQVGFQLDEQRRALEEYRLRNQRIQTASVGLARMGFIFLLAAAPNIFKKEVNRLTLGVYLTGMASMVASYLLPLVFTL